MMFAGMGHAPMTLLAFLLEAIFGDSINYLKYLFSLFFGYQVYTTTRRMSNMAMNAVANLDISSDLDLSIDLDDDVDTGLEDKPLRNVTIISQGSRGDIQPYVAIGKALQDFGGLKVRIITNRDHKSFVESFGLTVVPILFDAEELIRNSKLIRTSMAEGDVRSLLKGLRNHNNHKNEIMDFVQEMKMQRPDLLLFGTNCRYFGRLASHVLNIPSMKVMCASEVYAAQKQPTHAPYGLPQLPLSAMNSFLVKYAVLGSAYETMVKYENVAISCCNMKPILQSYPKRKFIYDVLNPAFPVLVCQSNLVKATYCPSVDENYKFVGACVVDKFTELSNSTAFGSIESQNRIIDFLKSSASMRMKTVYCGWGSMVCRSPEYMVEFAVRSMMMSGCRGILLGGLARLNIDVLRRSTGDVKVLDYAEKHVLFVSKAPHEWLFPRVDCTVHHGGAGTLITAMRAGVPTIVTPVFLDQFDHAQVVRKLGIGEGFTKKLRMIAPEELGCAIRKVVSNSEMAKRAKVIQETINNEDGCINFVHGVQDFWKSFIVTGCYERATAAERSENYQHTS